ncbi:hypothetical protein LDENG_00073320 [Lucifuga dentata]|nr:hypothetical protein LDENG_00073320 [Lucifuga dentata]
MYLNETLDNYEKKLRYVQLIYSNMTAPATRCAFSGSTQLENNCINNRSDIIVKFEKPFVNLGGSYNGSTGYFTVCHNGVYSFALTVHNNVYFENLNVSSCAEIRVNGATVARATEIQNSDLQDSITAVFAKKLKAGDKIAIVIPQDCSLCFVSLYNTFTYFLLYPMY